jgi:tetratricopeptide (TPR) repeat protein
MIDEAALAKYVSRLGDLRVLAARAVRERSGDARALYGAAGAYRRAGDLDAARDALERALAVDPNQSSFHFELAQTRRFLGEDEAAAQSYRRALEVDPANYRARHALVQLQKQSADANQIAELENLFAGDDAEGWRTLHLGHALAKTHEDLGDIDGAFAWLGRAKARRLARCAYDGERERQLADAVIAATPSAPVAGEGAAEPIFVAGLPRSGTTLVDRILSSHSDVVSAGELSNFPVLLNLMAGAAPDAREPEAFVRAGAVDFARLGELYLASTRPLTGATPRFIDKAPSNYLSAGMILRALPNARVVCVRRHPMDSVLSNYRQVFATADRYYDYAYGLERAADKFVQFDRVLAHWRALLPPSRYLELRYEDLVANQESVTRALLGFCGLDWNAACLVFHENKAGVATPSAAQVRQPLYASSVGRWRAYGALLDPARRVLERAGVAL